MLGLVVTEHLFLTYPDLSEGQLAKLRAAVVNSRALADVARGLDLGSVIRLGRGEETTGGRDKSSILADTMEAVIGAVFLQHGIDAALGSCTACSTPLMAEVADPGAGLDWKTSLQESASLAGLGVPVYEVVESGPDHAKTFQAIVKIDRRGYGPGAGRNKKEAEQNAAAIAFAALKAIRAADRWQPGWIAAEVACLSCPRSRWSGAAWPVGSPARRSVGRRPASASGPASSARVPEDFAAQLTAAGPSPNPDVAASTLAAADRRRRRPRPPGDERPVPARAAPAAAERHLRVRCTRGASRPRPGDPGLRFVDQRMFGGLWSLSPGGAELPVGDRPHRASTRSTRTSTRRRAVAALRRKRTEIKRALLDQQLVSGIGNIYADEALWLARLHYATPTATMTRAAAASVLAAAPR